MVEQRFHMGNFFGPTLYGKFREAVSGGAMPSDSENAALFTADIIVALASMWIGRYVATERSVRNRAFMAVSTIALLSGSVVIGELLDKPNVVEAGVVGLGALAIGCLGTAAMRRRF